MARSALQAQAAAGVAPGARRPGGLVGLYIRIVHALSRLCGIISAALIAASVAVVCQLVFMRYVLNASTIWQTELVVYMMIAATLVGTPYVQLIRGHVNVDLLPLYLGRRARMALALLCMALGIAVSGILGWYGLTLTLEALHGGWTSDTIWAVPLWLPYLALPVGFLILTLQYVADLLAVLTGRERPFGIER